MTRKNESGPATRQGNRPQEVASPPSSTSIIPENGPGQKDVREFLEALFHGKPDDLYILLWTLKDKKSVWIRDIDDLIDHLSKMKPKYSDTYVGGGLSPEDFGPDRRCKANDIAGIVGLWADIDIQDPAHKKKNLPPTQEDALDLAKSTGVSPTIIVHSGHGLQTWWLFREPWVFDSDEERNEAQQLLEAWQNTIRARASEKGWTIDATADLSRVMRVPGTWNLKGEPVQARILETSGVRYNPSDFEQYLVDPSLIKKDQPAKGTEVDWESIEIELDPDPQVSEDMIEGLKEADEDFRRSWDNQRSDFQDQSPSAYDLSIASILINNSELTDQQVVDILIAHRKHHGHDLKLNRPDYYQRTIAKAKGGAEAQPAPVSNKKPEYWLTESGNAERFVEMHGADSRYCHLYKKWFFWDGTKWQVDESGEADRKAKEVVKAIYESAKKLPVPVPKFEKRILNHAKSTARAAGRNAMLKLAESEKGIPVHPDEMDSDPWLLNLSNGTLDLKKGELRPHSREDMITKIVQVPYDPEARCPTWYEFLRYVTNNDADMMDYLKRIAGYTLTGQTTEQALFILHGESATGKTTFLQTIRAILGDYGGATPVDTLLQRKYPSIPNDLAALKGLRMVTASEVDSGKTMAESLVKQLTGGDSVKARFLYAEFFEYVPTYKIFLATNNVPYMTASDSGIWRRAQIIPFSQRVPDESQDRQLINKLKKELPGILAWAVQGCQDWQRMGIDPPDRVIMATDSTRNSMDLVRGFIEDCCENDHSATTSVGDLYDAWKRWARGMTTNIMGKIQFGEEVSCLGYFKSRTAHGHFWQGLRLRE